MKSSEERFSETIAARVSESTRKAVKALAATHNRTESRIVQLIINEWLLRYPDRPDPRIAYLTQYRNRVEPGGPREGEAT